MPKDPGKEEEKFEFNAEGEDFGYISLDQAHVLAIRTAGEVPGNYGEDFVGTAMAFEILEDRETDDHYVITLSFRPLGAFSGSAGREQFFISKEGNVEHRQVIRLPRRKAPTRTLLTLVSIGLALGVAAVIGGSFIVGSSGGDEDRSFTAVGPTETPIPTVAIVPAVEAPTVSSSSTPIITPTPAPRATSTLQPTPTARVIVVTATAPPTPTPTLTPRPAPTKTPVPASTPILFEGNYTLLVDQGSDSFSGKVVSFRVADIQADQTAIWQQGGSTNLDLTASTGRTRFGDREQLGLAEIAKTNGGVLASPSLQRVPPHVFTGTVSVDGRPAPEGTTVSAWIDGVSYGVTTVKPVNFPLTLSTTAVIFSPLGNNLKRVWRFSNQSLSWEFFMPGAAFFGVNTLTDARSGDIVWVQVGIEQPFQGQTLFPGWNLISLK